MRVPSGVRARLPILRHIAFNLAGADVYDLDLVCGDRLLPEAEPINNLTRA